MPRPPTGKPHLQALAVKLPAQTIDELRRYSDLHKTTISAIIREALDMRLHGPQQPSEPHGSTALPPATVAMFTRLATTLTTAAEQLRSACADATGAEAEERQITPESQEYNGNMQYNGNTIHTGPRTKRPPESHEDTQQSKSCPPFHPTKYVLGKLCPQRHEWGTTGQSLLSIHGHTCKECKNEYKRRKRAKQHQPAT
jgi:hypothetical protein